MRLPPAVNDRFFPAGHRPPPTSAPGDSPPPTSSWIIIAVGLLTSEALIIGVSLLSFAATCLFIGMVIAAHRRLQIYHGGTTRHLATVWWRGPWNPSAG